VDYLSKMEYTILGKSTILSTKGLWEQVLGGKKPTSNQPLPSDAPFSITKKGEEKVTLTFEKENW
jgi:hypothetical protein